MSHFPFFFCFIQHFPSFPSFFFLFYFSLHLMCSFPLSNFNIIIFFFFKFGEFLYILLLCSFFLFHSILSLSTLLSSLFPQLSLFVLFSLNHICRLFSSTFLHFFFFYSSLFSYSFCYAFETLTHFAQAQNYIFSLPYPLLRVGCPVLLVQSSEHWK